MRCSARSVVLVLLLASALSGVSAQPHELLGPDDLHDFDHFGTSVSAEGQRVVVGAPFAEGGDLNSGAVYVYRREAGTWILVDRLVASDGPLNALLGISVAVRGELIVAGTREDWAPVDNAGSAYVFRRLPSGWVEEAKLVPPVPSPLGEFGAGVAVQTDEIVVGMPGPGDSSGSAYVYRRVEGKWVHTQTLLPVDSSEEANFGHAVALDGDHLAVAARYESTLGGLYASGSVYTYRRAADGSWGLEGKLRAPEASPWDAFGTTLSLVGSRLAVGMPHDDDVINASGAVFVFVRRAGAWRFEAKLTASDAQADDHFGRSVAFLGSRLVVGAVNPFSPGLPSYTGSAYVFEHRAGVWVETTKVVPPGLRSDTDFGTSVGLLAGYLLVGAPRDSGSGTLAGQIHAFELP